VEFRLLGLLEVASGNDTIPLGHGKESALLAVLLLRANEPVSVDRLIGDLWGESPPPNAGKNVQQYVSRLRRRLGAERLERTPGGYLLHLEPDELDSNCFERLAIDGRRALDAGDFDAADRLLTEALALWRGPALADFRYDDFAQEDSRRLEGWRRTATADRVDARLADGPAERVLPELDALVAEDPLWERPRGQRMLALYRAGRQSEALDAYRTTRRLLDAELGIEPSRELQELERAILNRDPALNAPTRRRRVRQPRRLSLVVLVAVCVVGALAVISGVYEATRSPSHAPAANAVAAIDRSGRVTYTDAGTTPGNLAFGEGRLWGLNLDDRTIGEIDPRNGHVVKTFGTSGVPTDLAAGDGALWVGASRSSAYANLIESVSGTYEVLRIDPGSTAVVGTARLPGAPASDVFRTLGVSGIAVGSGAVWAIDPDGTISKLDPASGAIVGHVPSQGAIGIAAGDGGVWFLTAEDGVPALGEIDPRSNAVEQTIPVQTSQLVDLTVGAGSVWATDPFDGVVWRIEPGAKKLERTIPLGFGVTQIAFGDGAVWAANLASGTIVRIDPRTDEPGQPIKLVGTPQDIAVGAGSVWTSVAGGTSNGELPASSCGPVQSGGAKPDVLIASDLPLQGPSIAPTLASAIGFVLRADHYRAGRFTVGLQSCDDSTARSQGSDFFKCAANARAFAAAVKLVAVIGPYDSACAFVELPMLNRAPSGPLAMISPSNTDAALTGNGPEDPAGAPGIFYPSGVKNYLRLAPPDDIQGAADAFLVHQLRLHRVYVLTDGEAYGDTLAAGFRATAADLGFRLNAAVWDPNAASYSALAARIAGARPQAVFLAGYGPAGRLVQALRRRLGARVALIAGDGFLPVPQTLRASGAAAKGMYISLALVSATGLSPSGRKLVHAFEATEPGNPVPSGTYLPEALQAAELVLEAIARSNGTRASVLQELRDSHVTRAILGSFGFDAAGDMTPAQVTILKVTGARGNPGLAPAYRGSVVDRTISVPIAPLNKA
jgi:DNA-binding SARP family transcriptional activator/ABC-type branched-subunit amino acid transport system substrate-binding protein/streptogramin lyase